ncbi:MAG: hypothetical protein AAGJ28_20660, partial [Pseudomonadota bacterium]
GVQLTVDAIIYPWAGPAYQISADGQSYPSSNITTLRVVNNRDGSYGRAYAYVDLAGDDGSGVASASAATAQASPFATIPAAAAALQSFNNTNFGRNDLSNGHIVLEPGTHTFARIFGDVGECPFVIESTGPSAKATTVLQDPGAGINNSLPGKAETRNLTLQKVSTGNAPFFDINNQAQNCLNAINCGIIGATGHASWLYRLGRIYLEDCTSTVGLLTANFGNINKSATVVGCSGLGFVHTRTHNVFATLSTDGTFQSVDGASSNAQAGRGQVLAFSTISKSGGTLVDLDDSGDPTGAALVSVVLEQHGGNTSPVLKVHADGNLNPVSNIQCYAVTVVGGRANWLYNDSGSVAIAKRGWLKGCVFEEMNTKTDVFNHNPDGQNGNRIGNWPAIFRVGHRSNTAFAGTANGQPPGVLSWLGIVAHPTDVNGEQSSPIDPLWAADASTGFGDGTGGGDYTPQAASPIARLPAKDVAHPIDFNGTSVPLDGSAAAGGLSGPFDQGASAPDPPAGSIYIETLDHFYNLAALGRTMVNALSGQDVVFAPDFDGTGISGNDWQGLGNYTTEKTTFRSLDPARPARFRQWSIRAAVNAGVGEDAEKGNLRLQDLFFDLTHLPLMAPEFSVDTAQSVKYITTANSGLARDVDIVACDFEGSFPDFRVQNQEPEQRQVCIGGGQWDGLLIEGCKFRHVSTGAEIGGINITLRRNDFRECAEDFHRLGPGRVGGVDYDADFILVEENIMADTNSRLELHGDKSQNDDDYYARDNDPLREMRNIIYRGNLYYEGYGYEMGAYPTGMEGDRGDGVANPRAIMHDGAPAVLPDTPKKISRIRAHLPGETVVALPDTLPVGEWMAVQVEATDQAITPFYIVPPAGHTMLLQSELTDISSGWLMDRVNMTVKLDRVDATTWRLSPVVAPNANMHQFNLNDGEGFVKAYVVRDSVYWFNGGNSARTGPHWSDALVENVTMLRDLPGDTNNDGLANRPADGHWVYTRRPLIDFDAGTNNRVRNSVADAIDVTDPANSINNLELNYNDPQSILDTFQGAVPEGDGIRHHPTTPQEAISMARPRAGTAMATNAQGPLG